MAPDNLPIHYALLLFPQFEILDAFGPIEALNCLARASSFPYANDLTLSVIAATLDPVSTGPLPADPKPFNVNVAQSIVPIHTFDNPPRKIDVLIVPGGFGAGPKTASGFEPDVERVVEFIREWYPKVKYLLTICTGAGLAARAGVLDGQQATTNKVAWTRQTPLGTKTHWVANARWVVSDDSKLWTTSGVTAGTDGFLALLEHIYGNNKEGKSYADVISDGMEYVRIKDSADDPFAKQNGVVDVPPVDRKREVLHSWK